MDIDSRILFGTTANPPPPTVQRILKTKDVAQVQRYLNHLYDALQRHNIFQHIRNLDDDSATTDLVEQIDLLLGQSEDEAEQKCKARRPEYYSREIVLKRFEVSLLKCHLSALKRNQDRTQQLYAKMERTNIHCPLPLTQSLTRQALSLATQQLRVISHSSFQTRQAELDQRIQELSNKSQRPKQKILKAIRNSEQAQRTFRLLKAIRLQRAGTPSLVRLEIPASSPNWQLALSASSQLEDPKECQQWRTITDPNEVEHYLMLRNRIHFGQAQGTPFTTSPC